MKSICRKKNSEAECIPLGCLEHKWIACDKIEKCPVNEKEIVDEANSINTIERAYASSYELFLKLKRQRYKNKLTRQAS